MAMLATYDGDYSLMVVLAAYAPKIRSRRALPVGIMLYYGKEKKMIKHLIMWKLKNTFSEEEKQRKKLEIKEALEALQGVVPGLVSVNVITEPLPTSNVDIYLDTTLEDEAALKIYADHPAHVSVRDEVIVPAVESRVCIDYYEEDVK